MVEGAAVISGNGTSKPTGMLNTTPVPDRRFRLAASAGAPPISSCRAFRRSSPKVPEVLADVLLGMPYKLPLRLSDRRDLGHEFGDDRRGAEAQGQERAVSSGSRACRPGSLIVCSAIRSRPGSRCRTSRTNAFPIGLRQFPPRLCARRSRRPAHHPRQGDQCRIRALLYSAARRRHRPEQRRHQVPAHHDRRKHLIRQLILRGGAAATLPFSFDDVLDRAEDQLARIARGMYTPGPYRVPDDLPDDVAAEMLGRLDAVRIEAPERGERRWIGFDPSLRLLNLLPSIEPRFADQTVVVAGSGPSLTPEVAAACQRLPGDRGQ